MILAITLSVVALALSLFAFPLAVYAIVITKAQHMSTHRIEYVDVRPGEIQETAKEFSKEADYTPLEASDDDFNVDRAGI